MAKHLPIQNSVDQQPQTSAAARQALTRRVLALVGVEKKAAHASHQAAVVTKMENSNAVRSDGGKPEAVEVGGDASAVSTSAQLQRRPSADAQPSAWRASVIFTATADVSLSAMGGLGGGGWAAQNVAAAANRLNVQRLAVVPVVVHGRLAAAIDAIKIGWRLEIAFSPCCGYCLVCQVLGCFGVVVCWLAVSAQESRISASCQLHAATGSADEAGQGSWSLGHGSGLLGRGCGTGLGGCLRVGAMTLHHRLQRDLPACEIANAQHVLFRNAVISHLADTTQRNAKVGSQCRRAAALAGKPRFEVQHRRSV